MTDPSSLMTALNSLKVASDLVKALRAADVSYEKAEMKLKIAELTELLADARMSVLDTQEEIFGLRARIRELGESSRKRSRRDTFQFREVAYWEVVDGAVVDGPFCQKCLDADDKEIRLVDRKNGYTCCDKCNKCTETPRVQAAARR